MVLGIETSCDETAVAVLDGEGHILSNVLNSQIDVHARYGGVVPELASRRHMECIELLTSQALDHAKISLSQLTGIAVTNRPGLVGALLVGVNFAKALAYATNTPCVSVNHLEGHLASAWLANPPSVNSCHGFDRVRWSYAFGFSSESGRIPIYRMDNG